MVILGWMTTVQPLLVPLLEPSLHFPKRVKIRRRKKMMFPMAATSQRIKAKNRDQIAQNPKVKVTKAAARTEVTTVTSPGIIQAKIQIETSSPICLVPITLVLQ
jgi:hypothetical protein